MAGYATDTSTRTVTVAWTDPDGQAREVKLVAYDDGVNGPDWTATIDGKAADVTTTSEILIDGITPLEELVCGRPLTGGGTCTYWPIDDDDLAEHLEANRHNHPEEEP